MPTWTSEEIVQRKAAGVRMNRLDSGWNLPPKVLIKAAGIIDAMQPQTAAEERDKRILQLAFVEDMNAAQIARLNDPLIVGTGNRSKGKPLSPSSILHICYKYLPEAKERKYAGRAHATAEKRNTLYKDRQRTEDSRPKACSTCGSRADIELHHIIPLAAGGTNDYYNLIFLCHDCHMKLHHKIYDRLQWEKEDKENSK